MAETEAGAVASIIQRYGGDTDMLIPMMQDVQAEFGYLPQAELKQLSGSLGVPLAHIYSVATFYASFRLLPKGDHTIQLCMGTVCFLKGADKIAQAIQKEFELVPGGTSPDRKFTFAPVNCVGACALAPVMVVDGEYHGGLTVDSAVELLHRVAAGDSPPEGAARTETAKPSRRRSKKK
jgi:NADH-quinone oxidoreductase subunit E